MITALVFTIAVCATEPPVEPPRKDTVELTKQQYHALKTAADEVPLLMQRLDALRKRLQFLEERAGFRPVSERTLKRVHGIGRVEFPSKARRITDLADKGRKRNLRELVRSQRGTVITWWATWCKPCTSPDELRHLRRLKASLSRYGLELVSIAVDDASTVRNDSRASTWVYPYWQLKDGHLDVLPAAMLRTGGVGLPLFLVVDSSGEIRWIRKQALTSDAVDDIISAAVNMTSSQ